MFSRREPQTANRRGRASRQRRSGRSIQLPSLATLRSVPLARLTLTFLLLSPVSGSVIGEIDGAGPRSAGSSTRAEELQEEGKQLVQQGTESSLREALLRLEEAKRLLSDLDDRPGQRKVLQEQADIYSRLGEPGRGIDALRKAASLTSKEEDPGAYSDILSDLGVFYNRTGHTRKALDYNLEALEIRQAVVGDQTRVAESLNNVGRAYRVLGQTDLALKYYHDSLDLCLRLGERFGEAMLHINIGSVLDDLSRPQKAIEHFSRAAEIFREKERPDLVAVALNNIGHTYAMFGELERGLAYLERALELRRPTGNKPAISETLHNMGAVQYLLDKPTEALALNHEALELRRQAKDRNGEAQSLDNLGKIQLSEGNPADALTFLEQALTILIRLENPIKTSTTHEGIGRAYLELGNWQLARQHFETGLTLAADSGVDYLAAAHTFQLARLERAAGNLQGAHQRAEEALSRVEALRTDVSSHQRRAFFLASKHHYYQFYVDLLMEQHVREPEEGFDTAAFLAAERMRARSLRETLLDATGSNLREGDISVRAQESRLRRQVSLLEQRRLALQRSGASSSSLEAVERELADVLLRLESAQSQLRSADPSYWKLLNPEEIPLSVLQGELGDNTALLQFSLGDQRSFLWHLTSKSVKGHVLPDREKIETLAEDFYRLLARSREHMARKRIEEVGAELSHLLLGPVAPSIRGKRVVIVADGALWYVPFAALPEPSGGQPMPLLVDSEVVSLPSASLLSSLRHIPVNSAGPVDGLAILADPVFSPDDPRVARTTHAARSRLDHLADDVDPSSNLTVARGPSRGFSAWPPQRLRYSRQEAEAISKLLGKEPALRAFDFAASKETLELEELAGFEVLHLATHGLLNELHPTLSGLLLSLVDEAGKEIDGFLSLHDIYGLDLRAKLVVLSSCLTALGSDVGGEGLLGLAHGFLSGGSSGIIASLWEVDDRATAELMSRFYEGILRDGLRPAAALKQAQLSLRSEPSYRAPFYWAGFTFQGDWEVDVLDTTAELSQAPRPASRK